MALRSGWFTLTLLPTLALLVGACVSVSCGDSNGTSRNEDDEPSIDVSIDQETAIELVQEFAASRKVPIRVAYWKTEQSRVSCSQIDVDTDPYKDYPTRAKCRDRDTRPPYGVKTVTRQVKKYRVERRTVSQASRWKAVQRPSDGNWFVSVSFESEGKSHESKWLVDKDRRVSEASE